MTRILRVFGNYCAVQDAMQWYTVGPTVTRRLASYQIVTRDLVIDHMVIQDAGHFDRLRGYRFDMMFEDPSFKWPTGWAEFVKAYLRLDRG